MAFTGNENHDIDLSVAADWTARYRGTIAANDTIGEYFGKTALQAILDQEDCVGVRIYFSIDEEDEKHLIICGVKANEDDLYNGLLAENALKSPPMSGASNSLNS